MPVQMKCQFGEFDPKVLQALKEAYNQDANSFAESCNDTFDFKTCKRDNGTVYGIPDKSSCQTGKEVSGSEGKGMMTDARLAMGSDPRKLDLDVMQYIGPEALAKVMADNNVTDPNLKQQTLYEKAKQRYTNIRKEELGDDNPFVQMIIPRLMNVIEIGEVRKENGRGEMTVNAIGQALKDSGIKPPALSKGNDGVQEILAIKENRDAINKALADSGLTGVAFEGGGMSGTIDAMVLSALVGAATREPGMTAREMMPHGHRRMAEIAETMGERNSGSEANAAAVERTRRLEHEAGVTENRWANAPMGGPQITGTNRMPNQSGYVNQTYDGTATYKGEGKPEETLSISLFAGDDGTYRGEWSDGYKVEYAFGDAGWASITSVLDNGTDVTRAKWTQQGGMGGSQPFVELTSKNGAVTRIGNPGKKFQPVQVDARSLPMTRTTYK